MTLQDSKERVRKFFKGFKYRSPSFVTREFETFSDLSAVIPAFKYRYTNMYLAKAEQTSLFDPTMGQGRKQKATQINDILYLILFFFDLIPILQDLVICS